MRQTDLMTEALLMNCVISINMSCSLFFVFNDKVSSIRPGLQGCDKVSIFTHLIFVINYIPSTQTNTKPSNNETNRTKQKSPNILSFMRDLKHVVMRVYQSWSMVQGRKRFHNSEHNLCHFSFKALLCFCLLL